MFNNFNLNLIDSIISMISEFSNAVRSAFSAVINALNVFLNLFVSFFNRLSTTSTSIYSFVIVIFAGFVVFSIIKIWRD